MGFSAIPPRADVTAVLATVDLMATRSDVALIFGEPPWDTLLAGTTPAAYVARQRRPLADYFRAKGLRVWVYLDPANGLDRSAESQLLNAAGRSLTEPGIQALYREYAVAMDTLLRPDVLGLAVETNLVRMLSTPALYSAVKQVAADAAAQVRSHDASVQLSASVQVEAAWGRIPVGPYQGIETDLADFPFAQLLGLSSYPYFVWATPESLPDDYYSRLIAGRSLPVAMIEGGWSSQSVSGVSSDAAAQQRYIARQARLLDQANAAAVFQLTFTDLDLAASNIAWACL